MLDAAGLLAGLEKFSGAEIRKRSSSPKFQVHNTALITALQDLTFKEVSLQPERWGRWVESAIGSHLINSQHTDNLSLQYWRHGSFEVDFIIQRKQRMIGIEVKSGQVKNPSGMTAFQKQHRPGKILLVGKDGIPVSEFLKINPAELF